MRSLKEINGAGLSIPYDVFSGPTNYAMETNCGKGVHESKPNLA